ncbi:DsrE family protein [Arthrobacter sulfonylureivorans]|uniref:DsrE family protein n=1 Tax=Arthrobacter sulfonylureivorans TaxID=2486855 RepID=A0ABY3W2H6_9MICC|nr:DsrE family protein [Arthrobacter sulfonylureivorans]UNK44247.1 DsrE family protein [Arthrobacter sulfonylureivorans]
MAGILRSSVNARAALKPAAAIEVVVQGPGVRLLAADSPLSEAITQVQDLGVEIFACGNSMRSIGLDAEVLTVGIGTVSAAVAHLAERQWEGWAYVRP